MSMLHMDAQIFSSLFFLGRHMTIRSCRALAFCTHLVIENPWGICHVLMCMHIAEECVAIFRYKKNKKLGIILGSSMWWALEVWTWSVRLVSFCPCSAWVHLFVSLRPSFVLGHFRHHETVKVLFFFFSLAWVQCCDIFWPIAM